MTVEGYYLPSQRVSISGTTSEVYYIVDALLRYAERARKVGVEKDYNSESYKCISHVLK